MAVQSRDVFICFSKSRPGEAKVAIALKDQLEQNGLYAFEYEDWSWVAAGLRDREPDVDRQTLRAMLATCAVVVLISPHQGDPTAGVQTEIDELRASGSPVILLYWSPGGWYPVLDPPELAGLNIVWSMQGNSMGERDVADNQRDHIARQLGTAAWLACQVHRMQSRHPRTAGARLAQIPEGPYPPLLNFRLRQREDVDVAADASDDDWRRFFCDWRDGTDIMAETLAREARFSLERPLRKFHDTCEALCVEAERRVPDARAGIDLKSRGLTYARLNRNAEAIEILQPIVDAVPAGDRYEVYQRLGFAYGQIDPAAAIRNLTSAIEYAPQPELAYALNYHRGVLRLRAGDAEGALDDFSTVVDRSANVTLQHSALLGRAIVLNRQGDSEGAVDDYTRLLVDAASTPRLAVAAWIARGRIHHAQGRKAEAIADWKRAIDAADASDEQRAEARRLLG